ADRSHRRLRRRADPRSPACSPRTVLSSASLWGRGARDRARRRVPGASRGPRLVRGAPAWAGSGAWGPADASEPRPGSAARGPGAAASPGRVAGPAPDAGGTSLGALGRLGAGRSLRSPAWLDRAEPGGGLFDGGVAGGAAPPEMAMRALQSAHVMNFAPTGT